MHVLTEIAFCLINLPEALAVNVAHVPPTYHVPLLIKQPTCDPSAVKALRIPLPLKEPGVPVGGETGVVFVIRVVIAVVGLEVSVVIAVVELEVSVVVGRGLPDLGRYWMPVDGQVDLDPSVSVSRNINKYFWSTMA